MKYLTLTFALILAFHTSVKSQVYYPFPTGNVNWNIYFVNSCDESPAKKYLLRYAIHGDTLINKITYHRLCLESGDSLSPKIRPVGGIRELNKKIYYFGETYIRSSNDEEYLLYDFTKQIGDTIKHNSRGSFYSVVLAIDSILIDGHYRKIYEVDNHWFYHNPDYIVEGIGSILNGLLGHISDIPTCGSHYWEHICFREGGVVKYLNPSFSECFPDNLYASVNPFRFDEDITIFPTVTDKELIIQNNTGWNNLFVRITDLNGRIIKQELMSEKRSNIEIPEVSGLFNVVITDLKGKIVKSEKIIVK